MLLVCFVVLCCIIRKMGGRTQKKGVSFLNIRTFMIIIPPFLANLKGSCGEAWRKPSVRCVPQRLVGPSNFGRNCQSFWEKIVRISWHVIANWNFLRWYISTQNTLLLTCPLPRHFWRSFSSSPGTWDMLGAWRVNQYDQCHHHLNWIETPSNHNSTVENFQVISGLLHELSIPSKSRHLTY